MLRKMPEEVDMSKMSPLPDVDPHPSAAALGMGMMPGMLPPATSAAAGMPGAASASDSQSKVG